MHNFVDRHKQILHFSIIQCVDSILWHGTTFRMNVIESREISHYM